MASNTKGVTGLTGRYASALFELADEQDVLDEVASELRHLLELIEANDDLRRMIKSPIFLRTEQRDAMGAILDKVGAPDLVKRFVGLISSNRRLFAIKEIISDYLVLLSRRREEVTAEVTSAVPLSDKQTAKLKRMLRNSMGNAVSLNTSLDPSLLGGLIIKIGSRMIDSSLRNKLQQLRATMRGA